MSEPIDADQVRGWIDDELTGNVERISDEAAKFNFTVDMSNVLIHVIRRQADGPLLVGQQIEYDEGIRSQIRDLTDPERNDLVARIRETLTSVPVIYGFQDETGANVRFEDVSRIFLEHRIYPDAIGQHALMSGLVAVWKAIRYLDDLVALIDSVER